MQLLGISESEGTKGGIEIGGGEIIQNCNVRDIVFFCPLAYISKLSIAFLLCAACNHDLFSRKGKIEMGHEGLSCAST